MISASFEVGRFKQRILNALVLTKCLENRVVDWGGSEFVALKDFVLRLQKSVVNIDRQPMGNGV